MKILVIDDDPRVLKNVSRVLQEDYMVETVRSAAEAELFVYDNHYDLILMDLALPDMDGEDLCSILKSRLPQVPVIVVTSRDSIADKTCAFEKGADDYIVKPFQNRELKLRIKALLRRFAVPSLVIPNELALGNIRLDRAKRLAYSRNSPVVLRKKEIMLLEFLILNKGRVVTRGEMMEHVWDNTVNPLSNTVDVHVKRLRDKFKDANNNEFIRTVHGIGYFVEG